MDREFYVIGIGASRGGIKALKEFFDHIPADIPAAFIVLTHLRRDRHSVLSELLSHHTQLSIARVDQDVQIHPGNVYVLTENTSLTIDNGWLIVSDRDSEVMNYSVDIFFKSLATEFKDRAIGIILSGGGNDGLAGALQLAKSGGIVMAQTLLTAADPGMPKSIIDHDHPSEVLSPARLAEKIVQMCHANLKNTSSSV